jgi:hypothetical protein
MSVTILKDGTGACFSAKVDDTNRVQARSVSTSQLDEESKNGNSYTLSSLFVTLTSANASAILWFKNTETFDIEIDTFVFGAGVASGATDTSYEIEICRNPTSLTSGASTSINQSNNNFGSANQLLITSETGQEAATLVGGTTHELITAETEADEIVNSNIILPKSASIGIKITPPASTTSFKVVIDLIVHLVTHL